MYESADECWEDIPAMLEQALLDAPSDFVALECCANGRAYAKPDTLKWLLLWEANRNAQGIGRIEIDYVDGVREQHQWLYELFVQDDFVRFPLNTGDYDGSSLDWNQIDMPFLRQGWSERVRLLQRFSTASRSNLALVPESFQALKKLEDYKEGVDPPITPFQHDFRHSVKGLNLTYVNLAEWSAFRQALTEKGLPRAYQVIKTMGEAVPPKGTTYKKEKYRLYSIKTGVSFIGSTQELSKQKIEVNSMLAMTRSKVIRAIPSKDPTLGIQTELLTITAPISSLFGGGRDGFQVRDLSCIRSELNYLPALSIPYVNGRYNPPVEVHEQVEYWRENFAVPVGRAKAHLFLKYGLIHTSANAQNFVLGFNNKNELRHFVVRDIADTSWHERYIGQYLLKTTFGDKIWQACLAELIGPHNQTLSAPTQLNYQAPQIVRLAANSVLTHKFGDVLMANSNWQQTDLYKFTSGVLEGFRAYVEEAFELDPIYKKSLPMEDQEILITGKKGAYPYPAGDEAAYKEKVKWADVLPGKSEALFQKAVYVKENALRLLEDDSNQGENPVAVLVNAEEFFMCAGIEKLLSQWQDNDKEAGIIQHRISTMHRESSWPQVVKNVK